MGNATKAKKFWNPPKFIHMYILPHPRRTQSGTKVSLWEDTIVRIALLVLSAGVGEGERWDLLSVPVRCHEGFNGFNKPKRSTSRRQISCKRLKCMKPLRYIVFLGLRELYHTHTIYVDEGYSVLASCFSPNLLYLISESRA